MFIPSHLKISDFSAFSCSGDFFLLPNCASSSQPAYTDCLAEPELEYCLFVCSFIHLADRESTYFMPDPELKALGGQRCMKQTQKILFLLGFLGFEQQKWIQTNLRGEIKGSWEGRCRSPQNQGIAEQLVLRSGPGWL